MAIASLPKSLRFVTIALCFALVSLTGAVAPAQGAPAAELWLEPTTAQVRSGETLTLALWVTVENLDRVELHLDYDSGLEVQDSDPGRVGVQISPDSVFSDTCVQWNEAANGKIHFVAQRSPDKTPFSGSGTVARITLLVTAIVPGTYTVSFDRAETKLFDREGRPIPIDRLTDAVLILPPLTLTGRVTREGWDTHERTGVTALLYSAASPDRLIAWGHACTNAAGDFTLGIWDHLPPPPDDILPADSPPTLPSCTSRWAHVQLNFTNYLSECYWKCADGEVLDIGWHSLEGGDVNGDGCIDIRDITEIIHDFGERVEPPCYVPFQECPLDPPLPNEAPSSDINGDCEVNVLDLTQLAGNFGLCSNCP